MPREVHPTSLQRVLRWITSRLRLVRSSAEADKPRCNLGCAVFYTAAVTFAAFAMFSSKHAIADDLQLQSGANGVYLLQKQIMQHGSVLHVIAHPDDEDGAMLAYCARGLGARTMLFSLTRGEGGANLISSHFFDELGALRTLEHLRAASYYGIELFYSRACDYGYSKTLDEAMRQWDRGVPMLGDLVEVIRREQPTVMLSRFAGDPRDGHGHHQMAGVLSRLAFKAAADPTQFPEQLQRGLRPWQVKKLYSRAGSPWREPKEEDWTVALPTGTYDPVIGMSYAQVARFGLGFQRSQGISGHEGDPGPQRSYYRLLEHHGAAKSDDSDNTPPKESTIFDGLDVTLAGLANRDQAELRNKLSSIAADLDVRRWRPADPDAAISNLLSALKRMRTLQAMISGDPANSSNSELAMAMRRSERKLQDAIITASGLQLDAWATDSEDERFNHVTAGESIKFNVRLANQNSLLPIQVASLQIESPAGIQNIPISEPTVAANAVSQYELAMAIANGSPTRPHWKRSSIASPLYEVPSNGRQRPAPLSPFRAIASVVIDDVQVDWQTDVVTKLRHPEFGEVNYPLTVAPRLSVRFPLSSGVLAKGNTDYVLPVIVQSCGKGSQSGSVTLDLPDGWKSQPQQHELSFTREDEEVTLEFKINVPPDADSKRFAVQAIATQDGVEFREGFETVTARDLGRMNIYRDAVHHIQIADVRVTGNPRVAYIAGSGDKVAESLAPLGIVPITLSTADLAGGDLSGFDVILVGVRAYAVREDIRKHNQRLLDYVKRGGVLVVQYQTPEFDQNFGPYPYQMGRRPEEVSEETATVTMLQPNHPIFTTPNRISAEDFAGWYEQRGSKFWQTWDKQYTPLLECHDTGQSPQQGGMLVAQSGNGLYIYSAYAWYRQLPNGVPGAYRLFANMLSLPESDLVQ